MSAGILRKSSYMVEIATSCSVSLIINKAERPMALSVNGRQPDSLSGSVGSIPTRVTQEKSLS